MYCLHSKLLFTQHWKLRCDFLSVLTYLKLVSKFYIHDKFDVIVCTRYKSSYDAVECLIIVEYLCIILTVTCLSDIADEI